jgi:hypothetical protein
VPWLKAECPQKNRWWHGKADNETLERKGYKSNLEDEKGSHWNKER